VKVRLVVPPRNCENSSGESWPNWHKQYWERGHKETTFYLQGDQQQHWGTDGFKEA
jgi:hypothetical protein